MLFTKASDLSIHHILETSDRECYNFEGSGWEDPFSD
jgi:hypothetical protein